MLACIGFFQRADLFDRQDHILVGVGIHMRVEHHTGQGNAERIAVALLSSFPQEGPSTASVLVTCTARMGCFHTDLNMLSVCRYIHGAAAGLTV